MSDFSSLQPELPLVDLKQEPRASTHQIFIIQAAQTLPRNVVSNDASSVYETVSALQQLSRGQIITSDDGQLLQVYEEVVLPNQGEPEFVDVAEVEVSCSNDKMAVPTVKSGAKRRRGVKKDRTHSAVGLFDHFSTSPDTHVCRICKQVVAVGDLAEHHAAHNLGQVANSNLTCVDCGKLFKSKRSLFGHRKEKHSGVLEIHSCPECGKMFGRKSNLKAHRESLHYGKKFPCVFCDRIFTNRSSMNQHIKKIHPEISRMAAAT